MYKELSIFTKGAGFVFFLGAAALLYIAGLFYIGISCFCFSVMCLVTGINEASDMANDRSFYKEACLTYDRVRMEELRAKQSGQDFSPRK